jgi:hypothetical protein
MRLRTLFLLAGLCGCGSMAEPPLSETGIRSDPAAPAPPPAVGFHVSEGFWAAAPACVVVLPSGSRTAPAFRGKARLVERAVARQAFERFDRVIGPDNREALAHNLALDLSDDEDRRRFAELTGCQHGITVASEGGVEWAVVWTEARVHVEISLATLADGERLWQARHEARRGDGGLPISPLSVLMATGLAATFAQDEEVIPSLIDDAVRRAFVTLPDVRVGWIGRGLSTAHTDGIAQGG